MLSVYLWEQIKSMLTRIADSDVIETYGMNLLLTRGSSFSALWSIFTRFQSFENIVCLMPYPPNLLQNTELRMIIQSLE